VINPNENDLLEKPGWKHARTYEQALGLDKRNSDTLWENAFTKVLTQIDDYDTFIKKGHHHNKVKTPDVFNNIQDQIAQYQSVINTFQWIVTIGRVDINTAAMTMSEFPTAPRVGHLTRLREIYGYLLKSKHALITLIRVRTEEHVFSDLSDNDHD
jgi:hypothetical protein